MKLYTIARKRGDHLEFLVPISEVWNRGVVWTNAFNDIGTFNHLDSTFRLYNQQKEIAPDEMEGAMVCEVKCFVEKVAE